MRSCPLELRFEKYVYFHLSESKLRFFRETIWINICKHQIFNRYWKNLFLMLCLNRTNFQSTSKRIASVHGILWYYSKALYLFIYLFVVFFLFWVNKQHDTLITANSKRPYDCLWLMQIAPFVASNALKKSLVIVTC